MSAIAERDKAVEDVRKLREALKNVCDGTSDAWIVPIVEKALSDTAGYEE